MGEVEAKLGGEVFFHGEPFFPDFDFFGPGTDGEEFTDLGDLLFLLMDDATEYGGDKDTDDGDAKVGAVGEGIDAYIRRDPLGKEGEDDAPRCHAIGDATTFKRYGAKNRDNVERAEGDPEGHIQICHEDQSGAQERSDQVQIFVTGSGLGILIVGIG